MGTSMTGGGSETKAESGSFLRQAFSCAAAVTSVGHDDRNKLPLRSCYNGLNVVSHRVATSSSIGIHIFQKPQTYLAFMKVTVVVCLFSYLHIKDRTFSEKFFEQVLLYLKIIRLVYSQHRKCINNY